MHDGAADESIWDDSASATVTATATTATITAVEERSRPEGGESQRSATTSQGTNQIEI